MTGDTTPISDEAVAAFEAVYWHEDTAKSREWPIREALAAARPLLVPAEAETQPCVSCEEPTGNPDTFCDACRLDELEQDRDRLRAELDSERTARARDLVRYSQDAMFLRLNAAEADRDAAEAALAQLTSITPLATPVGGQEKPNDVHKPFTDDGVTYCGWDGHEGCGEVWPCSTVRAAAPVGGQHVSAVEAEPSDDGWDTCEHGVMGDHYFVEDTEWGVNHHYCPGRRHTAAAVSGEHQDATEDAQ